MRALLRAAAGGLLIAAAEAGTSLLCLRMLWRIIPDETFSRIFAQIATPETVIRPPVVGLLLLGGGLVYGLGRLRRSAAVPLGMLGAVLLLAVGLLWTRVNGIAVIDMLRSLVPLLGSGVV